MIRRMTKKTIPCEDCLDWAVERSRDLGANVARVVDDILRELGLDLDDPHVREVCARRFRAQTLGTHDDDEPTT